MTFSVLGIHGTVARVRMVIDGLPIDEDFPYPPPISSEERLTQAVTIRMQELMSEPAEQIEAKHD